MSTRKKLNTATLTLERLGTLQTGTELIMRTGGRDFLCSFISAMPDGYIKLILGGKIYHPPLDGLGIVPRSDGTWSKIVLLIRDEYLGLG